MVELYTDSVNIKISVIVPVYNTKDYLMECLDSIVSQSIHEIEVICINDASTDNSYDILCSYKNNHDVIKIINLDVNHGQAYARNIGIRESRGQYIYFLDSDDSLPDKNALSIMYDTAKKNDPDCILFDAEVVFEEAKYNEQWKGNTVIKDCLSEGLHSGVECYKGMLINLYSAVWRQFWKKEALVNSKYGFFDENTSPVEDLLFTFRNILTAKSVYYLHKNLYNYKVRNNSSMTREFNVRLLRSYSKCYVEALRFLDEISLRMDDKQSLLPYFMYIRRRLKNNLKTICRIKELEQYSENIYSDDYLYNLIRQSEYPYIDRLPTPSEIDILDNSEIVVVYGGGKTAIDVVRFLEDCEVKNVVYGVNEDEVDHSLRKYSLKEIVKSYKDISLILAVPLKYQSEMLEKVKLYGFDNPMIFNCLYM